MFIVPAGSLFFRILDLDGPVEASYLSTCKGGLSYERCHILYFFSPILFVIPLPYPPCTIIRNNTINKLSNLELIFVKDAPRRLIQRLSANRVTSPGYPLSGAAVAYQWLELWQRKKG